MKLLSLKIEGECHMVTVILEGSTEKEADDLLPYVNYLEEEMGSLYIRAGIYKRVLGKVVVKANTVFGEN